MFSHLIIHISGSVSSPEKHKKLFMLRSGAQPFPMENKIHSEFICGRGKLHFHRKSFTRLDLARINVIVLSEKERGVASLFCSNVTIHYDRIHHILVPGVCNVAVVCVCIRRSSRSVCWQGIIGISTWSIKNFDLKRVEHEDEYTTTATLMRDDFNWTWDISLVWFDWIWNCKRLCVLCWWPWIVKAGGSMERGPSNR